MNMKNLVLIISMLMALTSFGQKSISGAGATFPLPFYNQLISDYATKTGMLVTYGGIGSGGGIKSLKDKVVDFGASDAFLSDKEEADMAAPVVHMPTCLGAVVIAYTLPKVTSLKLDNETLAKIFMGEITKWNDKQIQVQNPDQKLPNMNISVIYRSDGSGTTYIFSDFMTKISEKWAKEIGTGKALKWPVGMGAKGNPGVAGTVKQTAGAIGYIGSEYAFSQKIPFVKLKNKAGNYIEPTVESITSAAQGEIPANTKVMLTNSADPKAYPICGFTWLIVYKEQNYNGRSLQQAEATMNWLQWILGPDAQGVAPKVDYAPLPKKAVDLALKNLKTVTYNGKPVLN
jgi:phosphate transport system substrate-binding protein